jgi:glyoxylate reductase
MEQYFEVRGNREDRCMTREEMLAEVAGVDALLTLLTDRVDVDVLEAAGPSLRVVSNCAVGFDNIDVEEATRRNILVATTPGVLTDATAELTWALILSACRRVVEGDVMVRSGEFVGWTPTLLLGMELKGRVLGVVGMGRIGRAVAERAEAFGMTVLYTRRSGPLPPDSIPRGAEWQHTDSLRWLLATADVVSIHLPLSETTHHLLGRRELGLMKKGSVLINTSRGAVIDERALVDALREGPLRAAGLDVYEQEPRVAAGLVEAKNVVLLPHVGSATNETRGRMAKMAVMNARAAVCGESVPHAVNADKIR